MISLALATGIPASVWAEEGEQAIVTAVELIAEQQRTNESSG